MEEVVEGGEDDGYPGDHLHPPQWSHRVVIELSGRPRQLEKKKPGAETAPGRLFLELVTRPFWLGRSWIGRRTSPLDPSSKTEPAQRLGVSVVKVERIRHGWAHRWCVPPYVPGGLTPSLTPVVRAAGLESRCGA